MTVKTKFFPLEGGLDQVSPAVTVLPGAVRSSENYEPAPQGYRRVDGFERFSGRPKPSAQSYWVLNIDAGALEPAVGRTVTGVTSGAAGVVVTTVNTSGAWATNDWAGALILREVTGTFADDESLTYSEPIAFTSGFSSGFN